jgi:hypothetical protein
MEVWFSKSIIATFFVVPAFIAIPFFKTRFGVDPMVFLIWYFIGTALSISLYFIFVGKGAALVPSTNLVLAFIAIGLAFGSVANGSLFQAVGLAPNPGIPPVIYATSSIVVFFLSLFLAARFPAAFKPVSADISRLAGIFLVLFGLYLLAGGRLIDRLTT